MSETIDVKINISDISQQLSDARQELTSLKNEIEATPSIHQVMGEGLDKTQTTVDQLKNKIDAFNGSTGESKERMAQDLLAGVEDVRISTNMFSKSGSFSVSLAKQMFSGLSAAAQSELNKSTAEITKMISSALGTIKSRSLAGMAREILYTPDAQRLFETKIKPGTVTANEYEKYISALLPNIAPLHLFSEYQTARYGSYHKNDVAPSPMAVLPKSFQDSYKAKRFVATNLSDDEKRGILPASERALLKAEISNNDAAARAARRVEGMTKRNSDNKLMLSRNISRSQFEEYKRNLWEDWVVRSSGRSSDRIDIFDEDLSTEDSRKVYQRITGSSAGKVLNAMNVADKIIASATWDGEKDRRGYETLPKEAARALEQYEITKLSFGDMLENRAPGRVTISESVNTRMQGLSGTHNQFTDKIVEMDFRGFDENNKDHEALAKLYTSGQPVNLPGLSKRYVAQNMHGTGEDGFVWRFVEEAAYNEVMQREIDWLKSEGLYSDTPGQGLSGLNYWNNFISESFDFGTRKNYRRHQDATGKPWTPGSDIEANLQNKNFGIIDVSRMEKDDVEKYADGIAWLTQGILPRGSIQGRFALGGKGTLHEQKARTLGQWAEMTGLIQPGERFILPGPKGDVDLTDMHGMFDVSTIKNMQAYQNFNTPESLNSAFSKMVARYGISSMTTYTDSDTRAKGIGSQAAMFMKLPQSMQELQVAEYKKRWNLLDTPTGIREFIMNSGNSHLENRLRAGEINESHPQIQYMVAAEKEAMARKALAGEQIDFSDEGLVRNQKVNKNPLTAILELQGGTREDRIEKIRDAIKKRGLEREYTDDEIAGIFGLGGNKDGAIVDFNRPKEELVAFMRSPNGFGQFVYGKNYASIAKEVFKAFGLSTEGAFLSEEDMKTIGTADYDGDAIKTAYGIFAAAIKDTAIAHKVLKESQGNIRQAREMSVRPEDETERFVDSPEQRLMATEDAIAAAMAMGLTSGAGEKAVQFDLSNPQNQKMLHAAIQANDAYDLATASAKNATRVEQTQEMKRANLLGRKWQFIPSKFSRLFNISGQDNMHVPDDAHIFTASNGLKVNLEALERLNIDRTNLPSANQDAVVTGLRSAVSMGATSESIDQMNAVMEALDERVGYHDLGEKSQALLKNMRALKLQTNARLRGMMTHEEEQDLSKQVAEAGQEIISKANSMSIGKSGKVKLPDGTEMEYSDYVNAASRAANIDIATNHLEQFGLTAGRLQGKYGDAASSIVQDLVPKGVVLLPASSAQPPIVASIPNSVQDPIHENKVPEKKPDTQQHVSQDDTHPEEKPAPSVNAAPASDANKETWQYKAPEHPMFDYLQALREDMEQSGLSEADAADRFVKWYNESVPVSDDPIEMTQESALKIIQNFIKTGKQPGYIRGDNDLSGDGASLVASDLEKLRTIEGSRALYEDLNTSIRKTASSWYRMGVKEEDPEAAFYNTALREINNAELRYDNAMQHGDPKTIGPGTAAGMDLANNLNWMRSSFFDATRAHFSSSGENVFESLRKSVVGTGDEFDRQLLKLNSWSESVSKLKNQLKAFENAREKRSAESQIDKEDDKKTIAEQNRRISEAKLLVDQGYKDLLKSNNSAFASQYDSLYESMTGKLATPEEKIKRIVENYRDKIAKEILNIEEAHAKQQLSDEDYESRIADFRSLQEYTGSTLEAKLLEQNRAQELRRIEVSNKRVENLRTQGRKLQRNAWGHRGSGLLSRSMYEWENVKDQYDNRIAALKSAMELEEKTLSSTAEGSDEYKTASQNLDKLKAQLNQTETAADLFSGSMSKVAVTMTNIGDTIGRVASQFGRQMFHNAMQEAKRFVQEFDASMTEIQMITGKTDPEMSQLGSDLIQTAIDMKVGVSDVTNAAADLYRQGLDDEDVEVRMEDVQKFAKVAKIKSSEASKIITTALSNDLVESSGEAMDALVALGDSAATTASEIAKGMQKSAASAKQAGVSYEQLVTMLTIITSKTQLGGSQAGTALQTLMYRLYRVKEGDDFYDENGNRIAANQASKALSQLGVSIYDDNGNARGAFDIMVDVAENWDSADNISQEMVLNALGAGRQRSNIATLIQGLAEDEGALMEKYMSLASGSEGITDEKYLSYLNSLQASLDAVKSSFDQLIASFAVSDTASVVLNFIAEFIQGLAAAEEASGALATGIKMIAASLAGLAVASAVIKLINGGIAAVADMAVGIGAIVALGGLWGVSSWGNNVKRTTSPSASNIGATMKERTNEYDDYREVISDSEKLNEKFKAGKITNLEIDKLQSNLNTQTSKFGLASVDLSNVATNAESVAQTLAQANRLQQAEFANQLKDNVAQAKTAVADEAIGSFRSSNQFNQLFATAMGGTLLRDGKLNYDNRNSKSKYTQESIKMIKGYKDLAGPEQDLSNTFNLVYHDETDFNWEKANSVDIQEYYTSRMLDKMLYDYVSTGAKSSDAIATAVGLDYYSYERLHQLLTSRSYKDLMETDGKWWAGELHAGDEGVNAEKVFNEKRAQAVAALWQYWDNAYSSGELKFEDMSKKTIDGILTNHVRPVVAGMVDSEQLDYVMSQLIYNVYKDLNLNDVNGVTVANKINNELETLRDILLHEGEYKDKEKTIESDYLDDFHRPKWNIYNKDGQLVRENVSQLDLDTFKAQQLQVKQAAPVSAESVDMSDWKEKNPQYEWDKDQKDWNIWQYADSNGNVHLGTFADMEALQSSDRNSKEAARNDRINVAEKNVNNVKTVQGYYKQIANKRDAISRFQKDAQNVDSYAELRELALGLPEEYHAEVAKQIKKSEPVLPAKYEPVQFDFLEEEVERLNTLYTDNAPKVLTALKDANTELKSAQDEVIAVNDIVMQPIIYNSREEWQAGYDTEQNNKIAAIKEANLNALDETFWNTDETGSGFYFSEITQSKQSSPKPVDYLSEALSAGLAVKQTDDVVLKNHIDDFARYLAINGVFGDESVDMEKQTDLLTSSHYGDLKTVMTSGIGLAKIIDGVFKKDDKGEYIIQDGKRVLVDDTAWLQTSGRNFYKTLMGASGSYSDVTSASRLIRSQIVKNIKESYDAGYSLGDNEISILSSLYGDSLVAKYQNAALNLWDTTYNANQLNDDGTFKVDEDGGYSNQSASIQVWINEQNEQNEQIKERNAIRKNVAGGTYGGDVESWMTEPLEDIKELTWSEYQKAALKRNAEIRGSANIFTEEEEAFMKILDQNALYGIDKLTSQQSLQGAENILGYISRGEYSNYLRNDATVVDAYLSQFSNFGTYASMAHVLEDAKVSDGADGFYTMNDILSLEEGSTGYESVAKAFEEAGISMEEALKTAEDFNDEIATAKKKYGDFTGEVLSNSKAWKGNKREISNAFKELNSSLAKIGNNQYYRTKFKNGARDKETLEAIGAMIGIPGLDEKYVEEHSEYIESLLETAYESDLEAANVLADSIDEIINLQDFSVDQSNISVDASGNLDMSGVMSALAADQSEYAQNVYSMIQAFAAIGGSVQLVREGSGENMVFKTVVSLGEGAKPRGGGGGGGGKKSATEKLLEEQEHEVKLREHKIKMIQYEETRYANANELSNEAIMIRHEIKEEERLIELKKEHLNELKKQLEATKKYSEEWYTCSEAILATEEAIAELNNKIDENKQKIEDLEQQVLKLHTDLESTVKEEIETRIQAERDMLDGTVYMQDIILEAIRDRYRKEWELMQEDIDKKRKALEEEIAMIDERLQRRKDAEDEASKYEELAELERQLALVSMDSTRTKDQRELRKRIEELQNELAWDAAEDEAKFQKDTLQDEIDAYTQYEEDYQEYLDDLLEDANNFSVEVNEVLQMSQEDMLQWLSDNVEEFRLSLEASQEQLTQNWTDTFKKMKGIVDTFWDEIIATLSSKESFMEYMKKSQAYQYASDDEKAQMEYTWSNMYDDWISAKKESDEAKNYDHKDAGDESSGKVPQNTATYNSYYGGLDSSGKWVTGGPYASADAARTAANRKGLSNIKISSGRVPSSPVFKLVSPDGSILDPTEYKDKGDAQHAKGQKIQQWGPTGNIAEINKWQSATIKAFSSGGYVDYTGLAMVHGSASRPESFLSAEDTALVRAMLDSWQFVLNRPIINNVDSALNKNGSGVSFGDLTIEINEASLTDDADIEEVARRVGEAFTKELSQSGLRTVSYNF